MDFFEIVARLKGTARRGWKARGICSSESVADHSLGVALLGAVLAPGLDCDSGKVVLMAVLHDLGEALVGDLVPADGVSLEEKRSRETKAMERILAFVDPTGRLMELWLDMELERTAEGKLVRELDRLEMALMARHYEKEQGLQPQEFFRSAKKVIRTPKLVSVLDALEELSNGEGGSRA